MFGNLWHWLIELRIFLCWQISLNFSCKFHSFVLGLTGTLLIAVKSKVAIMMRQLEFRLTRLNGRQKLQRLRELVELVEVVLAIVIVSIRRPYSNMNLQNSANQRSNESQPMD